MQNTRVIQWHAHLKRYNARVLSRTDRQRASIKLCSIVHRMRERERESAQGTELYMYGTREGELFMSWMCTKGARELAR